MPDIQLRAAVPADAEICGRILFDAFGGVAQKHGFPSDFPSVEVATGLAQAMIGNPTVYGVVAESSGKIVGCNFLGQRDAIAGVGPVAVDPVCQGGGVGRKLMQAVIERGGSAPGIRLVQEPFNTVSLALYAALGFEAREPLALMCGKPTVTASGQAVGRPMEPGDISVCAELCRRVHGWDRANELRDALPIFRPFVLVRQERVVAYASAPTFWPLNHGVAETPQDMTDLLLAAAAANADPMALLVPIRRAEFFRWCLGAGLRAIKPMTLMTLGQYQEPRGEFFPSVAY